MAQRLRVDLKGASLQVGKALNEPIQGVAALSRAGVQFTDQQEKQIRTLVESGRTVDAQRVILAELETQFGGSARAARDTFGGALKSLKNAFGDLLEAKSGLPEAQQRIEKLTALLSDPQTAANADLLVGGMITGFTTLAEILVGVVDSVKFLAEEAAAAMSGPADLVRVNDEIERRTRLLDELRKQKADGGFFDLFGVGETALADQMALHEGELQRLVDLRAILERPATVVPAPVKSGSGAAAVVPPVQTPAAGSATEKAEIQRTLQLDEAEQAGRAVGGYQPRLQVPAQAPAKKTLGFADLDLSASVAAGAAQKAEAAEQAKALKQRLAELRQALSSETVLIEQAYRKRMATISDLRKAGAADQTELDALEVAAEKQKQADLTRVAEQGEQQRRQQAMATGRSIAGSAAQLAGTLAGIQDQSSRSGFKQYQAFAKAQAGIQSALAILSVWSDASIPSMYAKIAASIAVGATTAVQVARIDAMQYQGAKGTGGQGARGDRLLVGERGPEEIVLGADATVIPNDRMGGGGYRQINSVTNVFQISPGLSGAIQAEIMRSLPMIGQYVTSAVLTAINAGGDLSRAVGRTR